MKILKRMIFIIVLLCPVSLFAQETVSLEQALQMKLDSVFWEMNYCKQRAVVLQTTMKEIQEQMKALKAKETKKIPEKKEADK